MTSVNGQCRFLARGWAQVRGPRFALIHNFCICDLDALLMEVILQCIFTPGGILTEEDKDIFKGGPPPAKGV